MERDACGGAVRFHDWRLPLVCPAEADKFKSWYRSRTGEQPPTGKAFSETEGLMVSMAFEMRFEKRDANLEPFANRFGERLKASNLDEPLQIPLALNRLYLWTPTIWLTERVREQFDSLNKERDFSILELRASGEFLRLTHPHISDAIYRAVRYPMVGRAFANDLANALKMAAETHVPTLRLLMRTLSSVDERIKERLNDVDLQHLAKRAAADWITERVEVKISETDALADLRVSWSCWHAQHPELALEVLLGRTPGQLIDEARQALDSSRATWPFLWRRLDSAFQNHAGLAVDALDWLFLPSSQTSRSWSFIWERVWDLSHIYPKLIDMLLLVRGAEAWLNQNAEQRTWHYIWKKLLEASRCASPILTTESVLARGWKWAIESADWHVRADHPAWTFVWQDLLSGFQRTSDQRNVLLLRGYDWLVEHEEYGGWPYVWDRLTNEKDLPAEISRVDLLLRGYDWLAERERWNQWGFVCERLLKSPEARHIPEVRERVVPWLIDSENQARAEWDKLLEHYLDAGGRDKTALNCAIEWIWKNLDKPQVPPFAAKILSVCENRRELDDLARWLSSWICVHQNNSQLPFLAGSLHPLLSEQELTSLPGWAALLKSLAAQPFIDSIIFAQLSRSKAFAADGRLEEALAELRQVADRAKTALDWYALAVSYGKTGCHEECVRAARKATEMEPEDPKYWRCLAIGLDNLGRNKKEVIEVRIRIAELTDTGLDWYALAVYYGKVGNSEEAVRAAQKAIEKEPLHSEYWCRLAVELANVPGNQKEARQARNRAAELAMTADNWQAISVANQRAGLYEPAIEAADKAIAIAPEHVEAWRSRAVNLDQIGRPDEAILAWKSVDELAGVATRMTTVDEALNDVQTNPKSMDAWRRLAYVYRRVGQASEAVSIARSAVELTPHIAFATIAVAEDLMSVLPEAVIGLVEDLIVLDPQNGNYLHLLGAARRKAGDLNGAVDALRKACSLDPKRPNYWYALGKALEDLRTLDEARIAYEKAVELKATYAKARRALERLTS
jgi:Flp pilus assembly protein TadD